MTETPDAQQGLQQDDPQMPHAPQVRKVRVVSQRHRSMWEDKTVRTFGGVFALLVIAFLAVIVSALYLGFIGTDAPRTSAERSIAAWETYATADEATLDQVQSYILALIDAGQLVRAQGVIDSAKGNDTFDMTQGQNLLFCEAELDRAKKSHDSAIAKYTEVMDLTKSAYETELEEGPEMMNWALSYGLHSNYYFSANGRATIYAERGEWAQVVEMLDIYLEEHPRESYILIARGDAKAELGDVDGAEADYREALRYIPDLPEALEALDRIGVAR